MPTWKAYFQINGYDFSRYPVIEFSVPEDLYSRIQSARSVSTEPCYPDYEYIAAKLRRLAGEES